MKKYIGVNIVEAEPMSLGNYNKFRGWAILDDEDPLTEGYKIEYSDVVTWCPKKQFEEAYRLCDAMTFGHAIEAIKKGHKVARAGWNGKNMFIVYMPPLYLPPFSTADTNRKVNDRTAKWIGEDTPLDCQGYIAMFTATKQWQPGWLASQPDMLAEDWQIVD